MKKLILNIRYINQLTFVYTSAIFSIISLIGVFVPLNEIINSGFSTIKKISISVSILFGIWLMTFFICGAYTCSRKCYKVLNLNGGYGVYVKYGDLFSTEGLAKKERKRNIVIPVNRCFDTLVDDDLISSRTLHGQAVQKLNSSHREGELNEKIQRKLADGNFVFEKLDEEQKRKGNLKRYNAGTIVEIPAENGVTFFLLALTKFDKDLHAHVTDFEYVSVLMKLLIYNTKRSQGNPLLIPLIGAGAAGIQKDERDILEFIIKLIKLNKRTINSDIYIIINENAKDRVPIMDL